MPFTPLHMGPGLCIKALLQGSFSLMVFGWAQILMDIQPLVVILTGEGHLHGFSHTMIGALLIAAGAALSGKYLGEIGLNIIGYRGPESVQIHWPIAILSALIGTLSHVLLDALMHFDVEPWYPFSTHNPFQGWISVGALNQLCIYSAALGGAGYYAIAFWLRRRSCNRPNKKGEH